MYYNKRCKTFCIVINNVLSIVINPLPPRRTQVAPFTEISVLFQEGIIKNISYERRAYESVEEKAYLRLCPEKRRKN